VLRILEDIFQFLLALVIKIGRISSHWDDFLLIEHDLVRVIASIWPLLDSHIWVILGFLARLVGAAATPTSDTQAVINVDSIAFILIFVGDQSAVSDLACLMNWSFKSRLLLQSTHFLFLASQINALGSPCDFN